MNIELSPRHLQLRDMLFRRWKTNGVKIGDKIEVMETRPISRLKRWRVIRVVEAAVGAATAISEKDVAEAVPTKTTKATTKAAAAKA